MIPSVYDGETLGRELAQVIKEPCRILIPRASIGNKELIHELEQAGNTVDDIPTYDTLYEQVEPGLAEEIFAEQDSDRTYAVFTSASTVRGFLAGCSDVQTSNVKAVCIGKQTAAEAESAGMKTYVAGKATLEDLVAALKAADADTRIE